MILFLDLMILFLIIISYSLGIILGGIIIQTTRSDYQLQKDPNEQIPYEKI